MKISIYKDTFANNRGADVAVKNLAAGLVERGHDVTLFDKAEFAAKTVLPCDVFVSTGTNELLDLEASGALGRLRVVQQFHTDPAYAFRHWIRKWRRNRAIKAALRKCAAIQVLREEHVATVGGIAPGVSVSVIGNWPSISPDGTVVETPLIVYPAAVNRDKNQKLLMMAFNSLKKDFPGWRLELYGKGTANGFCDLKEVYARCAILAFPSKTEGFGLAIAEAAAFSKPSVMIRDWIGTAAAGGGIVTAPTVRAYAAGLRRLMADAELRRMMGEQARQFCAERYGRVAILDRWETILRQVASTR